MEDAPVSRTRFAFVGVLLIALLGGAVAVAVSARRPSLEKPMVVAAARAGVSSAQVVDTLGQAGVLVGDGDALVMIVSVFCGHCHEALRAIAAASGGADLPGLHVVALEDASAGAAMLRRFGVRAGRISAPRDRSAFVQGLGLHSTPTYLWLSEGVQSPRRTFGSLSAAEAESLVRLTRGPRGR